MAKGIYKRKARRVGKRRGGGSKMNTCCKRAQRATVRALLPNETAAEMRARIAKEMHQ